MKIWRIKKLSHPEVLEACKLLNKYIQEENPDYIIPIASGGSKLFRLLGWQGKSMEIRIQHQRGAQGFIQYLPRWVTKLLRQIDMNRKKTTARVEEVKGDLSLLRGKKVLILDDAVDTGVTLEIAKRYVPEAKIAVVNNIRGSKLPDFDIYRGILVVFPWNLDYKV